MINNYLLYTLYKFCILCIKFVILQETLMDENIQKLIEYQVKEDITENELCQSVGITRMTFYNLKHGKNTHEYTKDQIKKFIVNNDI